MPEWLDDDQMWRTAEGEALTISEMEPDHADNCVTFVMRRVDKSIINAYFDKECAKLNNWYNDTLDYPHLFIDDDRFDEAMDELNKAKEEALANPRKWIMSRPVVKALMRAAGTVPENYDHEHVII